MRSAPTVSIRQALPVSFHLVRRPTFSASSQPEAAVRISAWRVAFSSMPSLAKAASTAEVHAVPPPVSTNSPSNVNSKPRALGAPAACRRDSVGGWPAAAAVGDLLGGMTSAGYQRVLSPGLMAEVLLARADRLGGGAFVVPGAERRCLEAFVVHVLFVGIRVVLGALAVLPAGHRRLQIAHVVQA